MSIKYKYFSRIGYINFYKDNYFIPHCSYLSIERLLILYDNHVNYWQSWYMSSLVIIDPLQLM